MHTANPFLADGSDTVNYSEELTITLANAPTQVTTMYQPTVGYEKGTVKLEWEAPSTFETVGNIISRYAILKDVGSGVFYVHANVTGYNLTQRNDTLSFVDTGLVAGQLYNYKVLATNVIGDGPESSILTGTAGEEPGIINTLSITLQSSTAVTFSWDPAAIDDGGLPITGYSVTRDDGDFVFDTTDASLSAGASSYT